MRLSRTAGLLAFCASANAFTDSSPFVLISTAEFGQQPNQLQLQTGSQVLKHAKEILSSCPTDRYLLVSQPNALAVDLRGPRCAVPSLCQAITNGRVRGTYSVAEVLGDIGIDGIADYIKTACAKKDKTAIIEETKLPPLPYHERKAKLADNDDILGRSIEKIQSEDSYTIIYLSSPTEPTYEAEFMEAVHMELKRQERSEFTRQIKNGTARDTRGLFEKYQFFTPGIFMGILATLLMLAVLTVGISALGSLQVSYGAFEKDMGPATQKK